MCDGLREVNALAVGQGMPGRRGGPPGDLYLELQVVAPPADTPRLRELYEALRRESSFDPRAEPAPIRA